MPITNTGLASSFITFSRPGATGGGATVTDSNGFIKWAGHNLLPNSESFDASAWSKANVTVSANNIAAPNGTTTADRIVEQAVTDRHFINQNDRISASNTLFPHTLAVFAKAGERQYINLSIEWSTNYVAATFDLSGGTVTSNRAGGTGTGNTSTITAVGGGWYLCTLTGILGTAGSNGAVIAITDTATPTGASGGTYLGDATKGLYIWGAHLYRSDLGGMVLNPARGDAYYPTTPRNLLGYTEDFSNAAWAKTGSVTSNAELAPNGLQTADLFSGAFQSVIYQNVASSILSTPQTASVYLKRGSVSIVRLTVFKSSGGQNGYVDFDLASGSAGTPTGNFPPVNPAITSVGNGWYRCSFRTTFDTGTGIGFAIYNQSGVTGDFYLWGAQLSDSASLDAYSPVYGAAVTSAAYYAPRLDFDPVTLAARGLLVEELRTNAITYSSDFTQWTDSGATVTSNSVIAPDGTQTADELARATSQSDARYFTVSFTGDGSKALSFYVKYNTSPTFTVFLYDTTVPAGRAQIQFGFTAGVPAPTVTTQGSVEAIEAVGGGWYRIKVVATGVVAANTNRFYLYPAQAGSTDGQKTTFWGAQAEVQTATFSTSLIPTNGAQATRTADVASVSTQAFPFSEVAGTLVVNYSIGFLPNANFYGRIASLSSSVTNLTDLFINGGFGPRTAALMASNGVSQFDTTLTPNLGATTTEKVAIAYQVGNTGFVKAGGTVNALTVTALPTNIPQLMIANSPEGRRLNGHIRQITYLPRRISNSELQARTV